MNALASALGKALRYRVRGSSRATLALANRIPSLQAVSIPVGDGVVVLDLRDESAHTY
jgi:hypothetical protein